MARRLKWLLLSWVALSLLASAVVIGSAEGRPAGQSGPAADALARALQERVSIRDWRRTGAIRWSIDGRQHLWDRKRGLIEVRFDDVRVLRSLRPSPAGVVFRAGKRVGGAARDELLRLAHAYWANDSFWLNPFEKLFDRGARRALVERPDGRALALTLQEGKAAPGGTYLFLTGETGMPVAFAMWVAAVPLPGVRATFEAWQTLATGARVSTRRRLGARTVDLGDVRAAFSLWRLMQGRDPFLEMR